MNNRRKGLQRQSKVRRKRVQLRVYCEGQATEQNYIVHWYRKYRDDVVISIANHQATTPLQLVERAVRERQHDLSKQEDDEGSAYDSYWCVFDVDEHPHLKEAIQLAQAHGIKTAISNPCLEIWFILHFQDQTAFIDRKVVQRISEAATSCQKRLTTNALEKMDELYETAKSRAIKLDLKHDKDGTPYPANPSSEMWQLIDQIRD